MNTRCSVLAAALALSSLVTGCADEGHIPIPQASQTFGSAEEFKPAGEALPAQDGVTYTVLKDASGAQIYSMWRIGYQDSFDVRYCKPPVDDVGEWYCRSWETWKLEGFNREKFDRPSRIGATTSFDGSDQFVTMTVDDAGEQFSQTRDCYVLDGVVDFGQCSDWNLIERGGI